MLHLGLQKVALNLSDGKRP